MCVFVQYRASSDDDELPASTMTEKFYDCLIQSIDAVKAWADRVPGFAELCKHDQEQLFQTAALELVMLRIAYTCRCVRPCYLLQHFYQRSETGSTNNPPRCFSFGCFLWLFLARDVMYTSRALCHDASPSVRLSVTEVHWRIIANLGFKFRSKFTAHWPPCCCGRRAACGRIISRHASQC